MVAGLTPTLEPAVGSSFPSLMKKQVLHVIILWDERHYNPQDMTRMQATQAHEVSTRCPFSESLQPDGAQED